MNNSRTQTDDSRQKTILIVEDSDDYQFLLSKTFASRGYVVAQAWNGREALAYLKASARPVAIVLDVRMRGMDAWQFRLHQVGDARISDIPVIVFSCEPNIADVAHRLDATAYLSKLEGPSRLAELVDLCQRAWPH